MTGGDQEESLWARPLARQRRGQDDAPAPDETAATPPRPNTQQGSLWAGSLAHQPEPLDDVVVRWELEDPEASASRPAAQHPLRPLAVALGVLMATVAVALVTTLPAGGSMTVADVPSYWEDVTMTCHTIRLEEGDRAIERFRCHAVGGGRLPPGDYRSPDTRWSSDITRREARASEIKISPDGELTGWAAY